MLLYKAESQSTMKLLIRNYEKKTLILVWLLETFSIITNGVFESHETNNSEHIDNNLLTSKELLEETDSFYALKVLYKLYDTESAVS